MSFLVKSVKLSIDMRSVPSLTMRIWFIQQLLMLEATLLFGGMGLHDQHSDLRLDVDNMSYEVGRFLYFLFWSTLWLVVFRIWTKAVTF